MKVIFDTADIIDPCTRAMPRLAPDLHLLRLHGPERKARPARVGEHDVLLTTYPLLVRLETAPSLSRAAGR